MYLSLLEISFWEILQNEWLGIVASVFILVSFLTSNQIKIRIINSIGCIAFIIYGFMLPAYSTAFMNSAMLIVHIVYLAKHFIKRHKEKPTDKKQE